MKKLGRFLIVAFLSGCAFAASPANATSCYPTRAAMAVVKSNHLNPLVLRGRYARQFVPPGAIIRTVDFAALLFDEQGQAHVFFGNVAQVCGPYLLTKEQVEMFLRPA